MDRSLVALRWVRLRLALAALVLICAASVVFTAWVTSRPLVEAVPRGVLRALLIGTPIVAMQSSRSLTGIGRWELRLPIGAAILAKAAIFVAITIVGLVLAEVIETGRWPVGFLARDYVRPSLLFSAAVALASSFVMAVDRLLGPGILLDFLIGRFRRARREDRFLLFADLEGSTGIAERIGDFAFHAFLDAVYLEIGAAVAETSGQIYQYVGDQVVVTWPARRGARHARALRCCLRIGERLAAAGPGFRARFGVAPAVRIGLHLGPVVAGEMGYPKREIVYLGDATNTAARIEAACRDFGCTLLVSRPALDRSGPLSGIAARSVGRVGLRGKAAAVELFRVDPTP